MSSSHPRKSAEQETIEAVAAAWLVQRDEGLTAEEQADFERWCRADPRHGATLARLEKTWAVLQQLRGFRPEARGHPDHDLLARPGRRSLGWTPLLAAAAVVIGLAAGMWRAGWKFATPAQPARTVQVYATTVDGYQRLTLEDGSLMELNARSEVQVDFTPTERMVRLVSGEAHFTVAKHQTRPFRVQAGAVSVRAVGTEFNVRFAERQVEVLVTEGHVKVEPPSRAADAAETPTLAAGQRVFVPSVTVVNPVGPQVPMVVEKLSADAIREMLAWQGPRLVFVDEPLKQVVAQFNRLNHVQIVLADPELGSLGIAGSFRAENVEGFIRLLTTGNEIKAEHPDPGHVVLRKAR